MVQLYLSNLHCDEETDEVGADEPYVLVTAVNLASSVNVSGFPVPVPAFDVARYGPFDDVDQGETHFAPGISQSFWGLNGRPWPLDNSDQAIFVVALMENDDGDPEALRGVVKGLVGGSVLGSLSLGRPDKVAALLRDVNSALGTPTGAPNFDDKVGDPQELRFSPEELAQAESGQIVSKSLVFSGDGGQYTLTFEARNAGQTAWRFCQKCKAMFFDGFPGKGVCPADGGGHEAAGFNFALPHDIPETDHAQGAWRFCGRCEVMFFDGFPNKGACPVGGHEAAGFFFVLPHDIPETDHAQGAWRFCHKCNEMFFEGFFPDTGVCRAGGGHEAAGFNFVLPHDIPESDHEQGAWRFCGKCKAMFFDGFPNKGACPAGGGHEAAGFVFVLPHDIAESDHAQGGWRFCGRCNAMFFDGFPSKGACPVGGHEAAGFFFVLPHDIPESEHAQGAWRFCHKCNEMFFEGFFPDTGVCRAGGGHEAAGFTFVLDHS